MKLIGITIPPPLAISPQFHSYSRGVENWLRIACAATCSLVVYPSTKGGISQEQRKSLPPSWLVRTQITCRHTLLNPMAYQGCRISGEA